jgi:hypothetical protein
MDARASRREDRERGFNINGRSLMDTFFVGWGGLALINAALPTSTGEALSNTFSGRCFLAHSSR